MKHRIFVTGIGTEIGKTLCSAILVHALDADYWKPLQAGNLDTLDREFVKQMSGQLNNNFFPERYLLQTPCSPHLAAKIDGVHIKTNDFVLPDSPRNLIIEGAGGVLVPINEKQTILHLIKALKTPVILVSKHYLGSINHTLLSISALRKMKIPIIGVLFNGGENTESETIICELGKVRHLGTVNELNPVTDKAIQNEAVRLRKKIEEGLFALKKP